MVKIETKRQALEFLQSLTLLDITQEEQENFNKFLKLLEFHAVKDELLAEQAKPYEEQDTAKIDELQAQYQHLRNIK